MSILESLCRLVGDLNDENKVSPRHIRLELSPQGVAVQGDRTSGFMRYTSRIVLPYADLDRTHDPEGIIVDAIRKVRESLTFPEDRT